jgi:hypothetical protein
MEYEAERSDGCRVGQEHTKIYSGLGRRSEIPYIHFLYIALGRVDVQSFRKLVCECVA